MVGSMSAQNTGGQAFPCLERGGNGLDLTDGGMTLRDYFAAKAMQSLFQNTTFDRANSFQQKNVASLAYQMADSMLKAREQ